MNIIALTGHAVRDPELKYTASGTAILKGTIAVRRDFKNQDGSYETDFINFTAFSKLAELIANHLNKGDKFGINGKLQIDVWENQDGKKQYAANVIANGFDFPTKKDGGAPSNVARNDSFSGNGPIEINDKDLPF